MKKPVIYVLVSLATGAAGWVALHEARPTLVERPVVTHKAAQGERPYLPGALPQRPAIEATRGQPFASRSWAHTDERSPAAQAAAAPAVVAPPMPYKFVGKLVHDGRVEYFLAKGDLLLPVKTGDIVDGPYRVEAVDTDVIALRYLPLDTVAQVAISSPNDNPPTAARVAPIPPFLTQALQPPTSGESDAQPGVPMLRAAQLRGPRTPASAAGQ
jgi:hypothetical protein